MAMFGRSASRTSDTQNTSTARLTFVVLIALASALLAACESEGDGSLDSDESSDTTSDESSGSSEEDEQVSERRDAGVRSGEGGAIRNDSGTPSSARTRDAGPMIPGTMPPPPDDIDPAPRDAGSTSSRDGSAQTRPSPSADLSSCTPPPAAASASAVNAWTMLNELRLPAGAGCINMAPELMKSAQAHCDYRAMNRGNSACLTSSAHNEVMGCPGFTGANVQAREIAAGYPRQLAYTEVALSYGDNPMLAIPGWLVTPFHRIPMLDPWTTDMGWGGGPGCDLIDFGRGTAKAPDATVVVFPYDGQTNVPLSFNGLEAPQPPAPAGGWPSSYPVSIYAQQLKITEHVLTREGSDTPLAHTWLDTQNPGNAGLRPYFANTALLYGAPFEANTTYRVKLVGTYVGGALEIEVSFTTGAMRATRF